MGDLDVDRLDPVELRQFTRSLLGDVQVLERMLSAGALESGTRRIGCEQEMFLVDRAWRPLPAAVEILRLLSDPHFTTELGLFNLEVNLDCAAFEGDCLWRMEADLESKLKQVRCVAQDMGGDIVLTGILPSIRKSDLGLENITPMRRYQALNRALKELRGGDYEFRLKGADELVVTEDSVMLEACCTSFQVHYQTDPDDFARMYNIAQAVTGPLLAAAVNSPMLFGRRLWLETRVPLFQQSLDTRSATASLRERSPRVGFGECWLDDSVLELFREDISRFRVLLGTRVREDSAALFRGGDIPRLKALQVHSGTVYRWNRGCYGLTDGKPHLRIENRVLPAGPTAVDEISNAAFFFGLMRGMPSEYPDVRSCLDFDDAQLNFMNAAQSGLRAQFRWMRRKTLLARDLILEELLPIAREGLMEAA